MRRRWVMMALAGAAAVLCAAPLAATHAAEHEAGGGWRKAIEIPGLARLSAGGPAVVSSLSCPSAGGCAVGGFYMDRAGHLQAFVVSERNGRWGKALEVPGSGLLNAGGDAVVGSVSCAWAGNCTAGGFYRDSSLRFHALVVSERNGRWGKALEVPGSGSLNAGGNAEVSSVSCNPAGPCAAVGDYKDGSGQSLGFVVSRS